MKTIELSTASRSLAEYAKDFGDEIVVLTAHRKPVAAVVSLRDVDREGLRLGTDPEFMAIIEQARAEFRSGRKLSLEEMRREVL